MKKSRPFLFFSIFVLILTITGCLSRVSDVKSDAGENPAVRFTPSLAIRVSNKYGDISELELCEIVMTKTSDMRSPYKRFRLYKNGNYDLNGFSGGEIFYIGAFIDADKNLEVTYGTDPVGGAYSTAYDASAKSRVEISYDRPTVVELKLLRPITGRTPAHNTLGAGTMPVFSWNALPGITSYQISVYDSPSFIEYTKYQPEQVDLINENALLYWRAVSYSNIMTYAGITYNKDVEIFKALPLTADSKHRWSLVGFDSQNEVWAYAPGISFLP
jgi:hypothetical protein